MPNDKKLLVFNVVSSKYYHDCRIKGSISVPNDELEEYAKLFDREKPIVVYCISYECPASMIGWKILHKMEFKNIWAYEGGMNEWYHAKFPLEGACVEGYITTPIKRSGKEESEVREINIHELRDMMKGEGLL